MYLIEECCKCPFYDNGDDGYGAECQYPVNPSKLDGASLWGMCSGQIAKDCPLKIQDMYYYQNDGTLKIDYTHPTTTTVNLNELNKKE